MNLILRNKALAAGFAFVVVSSPVSTFAAAFQKGTAVAYPWVFNKGNKTSRTRVATTADELARKAGFTTVPLATASTVWAREHLPIPGGMPSAAALRRFGRSVKASKVLYGSVSWHTRSIWVNAGPKTISTATVNAYVFDVARGRVVYRKVGVGGRSDEKESTLKLVGDVLLTPIVTAVSGGPATPQEQRAAQIALARAYHDWVRGQA